MNERDTQQQVSSQDAPEFFSLLRATARGRCWPPWRVQRHGVSYHGPNGHWAQVNFKPGSYFDGRLGTYRSVIWIFAGTLSPFLMRVVNKLDPEKPPPPQYLAAHTQVAWQVEFEYLTDGESDSPRPLTLPLAPYERLGVRLGPGTAPGWLDDALRVLMARCEELASDIAIRDWLTQRPKHVLQLRYAALLTRHLKRESELPTILDMAQRAKAEQDDWWRRQGREPPNYDRRKYHMDHWSHERFMRFLSTLGS